MEELNDETINKIAEAVKLKRISNVWKDPKKAQSWGLGGWILALYGIGILSAVLIGVIYDDDFLPIDKSDKVEFRDIAISNMDCDSLRHTLLDLGSETSWDVEKQIVARCLT